jgi:hypothetical protein
MQTNPLDLVPVWGVFVATVALILAFVEIGFLLGLAKRRRKEDVKEAAIGSMVGATLGLLAFMLGFTFSMAASRHDTRRSLVLEEANTLQTAYLRAELLPQPQRSEIRSLLPEYVETRLNWADQRDVGKAIARSEEIQQQLWSRAVAAGENNPGSVVVGLFIETLNEVIDLHAKRVRAGLWSRIPAVILFALFFVTFLAMVSMGYLAGISGKRANLVTIALGLAFSAVLFLIIDLDRPLEGLIEVSQRPMMELRQSMAASPWVPLR